jgi:hypothetical protein
MVFADALLCRLHCPRPGETGSGLLLLLASSASASFVCKQCTHMVAVTRHFTGDAYDSQQEG